MIIAQYQKLKKAPQSKNLEMWLHSWEKTYKDTLDIDLPDMQGNVDNVKHTRQSLYQLLQYACRFLASDPRTSVSS